MWDPALRQRGCLYTSRQEATLSEASLAWGLLSGRGKLELCCCVTWAQWECRPRLGLGRLKQGAAVLGRWAPVEVPVLRAEGCTLTEPWLHRGATNGAGAWNKPCSDITVPLRESRAAPAPLSLCREGQAGA